MGRIINFLLVLIFFLSCSNDLDINAEWDDIPVIYSVLNSGSVNQSNTEHYIRVQKSFLGDFSASQMAQFEDSIYYNDNDIKIWVEKIFNNQVIDSINMDLVSNLEKAYGYFNNDNHRVYKFNSLLTNENGFPAYKFKINLLNEISNELSSAEVDIVEPIRIRKWPTNNSQSTGLMKLGESNNPILNLEVNPSINGKMYRFFVRFKYIEVDILSGLKDSLFVDWKFSPKVATEYQLNGNSNLSIDFNINSIEFFQYLASVIPLKENIYRYTDGVYFQGSDEGDFGIVHPCIELHFEILDADMYNYFISQNSTGLVQNRPIYSNIENGIGLVSSISQFSFQNLKFDNKSNDSLAFGQFTKNLNFACFKEIGFGLDTVLDCQ